MFNLLYNTITLSPKYKAFADSKVQFPLRLYSKQKDMNHIQLKTEVGIVNKRFFDAAHLHSSCTQDSTYLFQLWQLENHICVLLDYIKSIQQPWKTPPDYMYTCTHSCTDTTHIRTPIQEVPETPRTSLILVEQCGKFSSIDFSGSGVLHIISS